MTQLKLDGLRKKVQHALDMAKEGRQMRCGPSKCNKGPLEPFDLLTANRAPQELLHNVSHERLTIVRFAALPFTGHKGFAKWKAGLEDIDLNLQGFICWAVYAFFGCAGFFAGSLALTLPR